MSSFKSDLKMLLLKNNLTMTQLVQMLNEKYNRTDSIQNLNNKLSKETIRYTEILEIAEVLNYEIIWMEKTINHTSSSNQDEHSLSLENESSIIKFETKRLTELADDYEDSVKRMNRLIDEIKDLSEIMKKEINKTSDEK